MPAEATFEQTLTTMEALAAQHVMMTHIEESDGLGCDDLVELAERVRSDRGIDLTFAHDTMTVEV